MCLQAVELLKRIGAFSMALDLVNQRLSEAIAGVANGRADGDSRTTALVLAGNEILDTHKNVGPGRLVSRIFDSTAENCVCDSAVAR